MAYLPSKTFLLELNCHMITILSGMVEPRSVVSVVPLAVLVSWVRNPVVSRYFLWLGNESVFIFPAGYAHVILATSF